MRTNKYKFHVCCRTVGTVLSLECGFFDGCSQPPRPTMANFSSVSLCYVLFVCVFL